MAIRPPLGVCRFGSMRVCPRRERKQQGENQPFSDHDKPPVSLYVVVSVTFAFLFPFIRLYAAGIRGRMAKNKDMGKK